MRPRILTDEEKRKNRNEYMREYYNRKKNDESFKKIRKQYDAIKYIRKKNKMNNNMFDLMV